MRVPGSPGCSEQGANESLLLPRGHLLGCSKIGAENADLVWPGYLGLVIWGWPSGTAPQGAG
jgi:hypothetical protein